jgi:hypothetical protein
VRRRVAVLAVGLVVAASAATTAGAHTYGYYYLSGSYLGTRSTITESGTWSTSASACIEFYSNAGASPTWIQAGMYRCFNGTTIDGTCVGGAASYVEVNQGPAIAPVCTQGSGVGGGTTHKYTVDNTSGSNWSGYVDGNLLGTTLVAGSISPVNEVGEYSNGCSDTFTAAAGFEMASPVWQTWNGSSWSNVTSASASFTCGWSKSGTIASGWTTSH